MKISAPIAETEGPTRGRPDVSGRGRSRIGEKPHDSDFPAGSVFGSGSGADSSWDYQGAFMYHALYLWWFYAEGTRTTIALRQSARGRANLIINNAFAQHPGFVVS